MFKYLPTLNKLWQKKYFRILCYCCLTGFTLYLIHSLCISVDGLNDNLEKTDIALVLGNKVYADGTVSPCLKSRLDKALDLYQKGYFKLIIVSGGLGKEGYDEATAMKQYLINKNVPEAVIIVDSDGINTHHSAVNTKKILEEKNLESVMIISNYYHISRSRLALRQQGIENTREAHAELFEYSDPYALLREFAGYYVYHLRY